MSFLAPWFLLGALAVAAPIVFHLIRRTTRERTIFSSLMFLQPTPPRLTRRSRLEHLLLLLFRCTVLLLLALGFSRPFFRKAIIESASASGRRTLVLLDDSASMRRANLWTDAKERVGAILRKSNPADEVALWTFDRRIVPVVTFEEWKRSALNERVAMVLQRLGGISAGWASTKLGDAVLQAAEALGDSGGNSPKLPGQIIVVTDLQEGSHAETLQGYEWPKGVELAIEVVKPKRASNAALQLAGETDEAGPRTNTAVRVRVSNAVDSKKEQFKIGWVQSDGLTMFGSPAEIYVPAGQSRVTAIPVPPSGGTNGVSNVFNRLVLRGDEEDFDNTAFVIPPAQAKLSVLYLGNDSGQDPKKPLYFLQRALQETQRQEVKIVNVPADAPLSQQQIETATLIIVTDVLGTEPTRLVRAQITSGNTALFALQNTAAVNSLAAILGLERLTAEEVRPPSYAMLGEIDFHNSLLAPFADPRFSDFTKIHFWKYRRLDATTIPGERTIASFDNGDPALFEVPVGKGRVIVLTSGWQPEESQLALSTKFVPLLYSLLEESGAPQPGATQYRVGDVIPLGVIAANSDIATTNSLVIRAPDGNETHLAGTETNFSATTPGIYAVEANGGRRLSAFAVNLDESESRLTPLQVEEFEKFGAPLSHDSAINAKQTAQKIRLQNGELEQRQKLWRWIIAGTLLCVLLETWLAGRTARAPVAETRVESA